MLFTVLVSFFFAGLCTILWQRIITATDGGRLSWLFIPIESLIGDEYNVNVRTVVGIIVWFFLSIVFGLLYWYLVESNVLTYYDGLSVGIFTFVLYSISQIGVLPFFSQGVGGWKISTWLWLESIVSWVLFGVVLWVFVHV
ncbi:MAG: hypothetical protein ACPGO5_00770 [Patescibacteria group bacterium]